MEDSSTNPYIPQESEAIRQKVYEHQSPLGRVVKWLLIITVFVAVLVGVGLYFVIPKTTAVDQPARVKLADVLQPPDQTLKRVDVQSQSGFRLNYDNHVYNSYAEVGDSSAGSDSSAAIISGQTYENNDLRVPRAYNYVRIRPIESVDSSRALETLPPQLEIFATVTDKVLTTASAIPENKGKSKLSLFVKLDSDKRAAKRVADDKTVVTIDVSKPVSTTIAGIDYQKVRYTTTNDNHRISNVKYDECYYTIQNAQPYSICVSGVRPTNVSAASLVEQVFNSITYQQPATSTEAVTSSAKKTTYAYPLARLTQATTTDDSSSSDVPTTEDPTQLPLITMTPDYYANAAALQSIAKNQPSAIRIGTIYCTDLSLKFETGDTATTLTDACVGNVASGVFISKDGYIATTGHAIRTQKKAAIGGYINFAPDQDQMLDRLQRVLDYLLKSKLILQSDADYIKQGAAIGDQEALAKIENIGSIIPDKYISAVNEAYSYAIQPTDKPIVINRSDTNKPSFAYSDSVLNAKYVASDYDATKSIQEVFGSETPTTDTGLLKADGSFPDVVIVTNEDVKADDILNTIGYTAYTDSSLTVDKIRNLPVVTTSKVEQAYQKDGGRLIQTNTAVLPGNDGAPVVDTNGKLIGFAVYGLSYCPDQLCFANGTVRSSNELVKLLKDSNIKLATGSQSAASWTEAVNQYFRANYAAAASGFGVAGTQYPFNRWATPLDKLASTNKGSSLDTSLMNQLQTIMIIVLVILVILTIILIIAFLVHRRRIRQLQVGHYGAALPQPETEQQQTVTMPVIAESESVPVSVAPTQPSPPTQINVSIAPTESDQSIMPQTDATVPVSPVPPVQADPTIIQIQQPHSEPSKTPGEDPFYK